MLNFWSKDAKVRKKANLILSQTKSILEKNVSKINPGSAALIKQRIGSLEAALAEGDTKDITIETDALEGASHDYLSKYMKSKLRQNVEALVFAVVLALLIRTFIFQPFKIPSGSMIPTLLVGDHLLVNKFIYGTKIPFTDKVVMPIRDIERGDVIVFTYPNPENDPAKKGVYYIKRVVGLPGDSIDIKGRSLYINDEEVPMDFIGTYRDARNGEVFDEYDEDLSGEEHTVIFRKGKENTNTGNYIPVQEVPQGSVFVMGDNRDNSQDSRYWGFAPIENIAGKAFMIHWSWDFDNPELKDKVRWNRILSGIN